MCCEEDTFDNLFMLIITGISGLMVAVDLKVL